MLLTQRQTVLASLARNRRLPAERGHLVGGRSGGKVQPPLFVFAAVAFAVMAFAAAQVLLLVRGRRVR